MKKYYTLFVMGVADAFSTPASVFYWVLVDVLSVGVMPFLWIAVVHARGESLHGFGVAELITYFLGSAMIWQAVVSYPFSRIISAIKSGDLAHDLIRPMPYILKVFFMQLGHRIPRIIISMPFLLAILITFHRFILFPKNITQVTMLFTSLVLAYLLIFLMHFLVGMVTFWLDEAEGVVDAFLLLFMLFSGDFAPLTFFPEWLFRIASFLPFQYVLNFPLQIYLGHIDGQQFLFHMTRIALWMMFLGMMYTISWHRGVRLFTGVGR